MNFAKMTLYGGGLGLVLLAAALSTSGNLSILLWVAGILASFVGLGGIFFGGLFAFASLLERLGIFVPTAPGDSSNYWRGYNDGWDDRRY